MGRKRSNNNKKKKGGGGGSNNTTCTPSKKAKKRPQERPGRPTGTSDGDADGETVMDAEMPTRLEEESGADSSSSSISQPAAQSIPDTEEGQAVEAAAAAGEEPMLVDETEEAAAASASAHASESSLTRTDASPAPHGNATATATASPASGSGSLSLRNAAGRGSRNDAAATTTTAFAARSTPRSNSSKKSKSPRKHGTPKPPPPPPPAIPPPPDPSSTVSASSKPSSAVLDSSSITLGLIGSPSAAAMVPSRPLDSIDESSSTPDKWSKIDIRDARRRREMQALGDSPGRGGSGGRRKRTQYEEENVGYGEQMRVATSRHVRIPTASTAASTSSREETADTNNNNAADKTGGGGGGDVGRAIAIGSASAAAAAAVSASASSEDGKAGTTADTATTATAATGTSSTSTSASARAQAAARLQALRTQGAGGAGINSGGGTRSIGAGSTATVADRYRSSLRSSHKSMSMSMSMSNKPAPPSGVPTTQPPPTQASILSPSAGSTTSSATSTAKDSMAAKIQSLNENKGKATTAAQERAAELANLRRKGIAKIFNRHFTAEAATIAKEKEAADRALAELERQKAELAQQHRAYKNKTGGRAEGAAGGAGGGGADATTATELSQIEAMAAEIRRRRVEVRQKEQETKELYRRYVCQFGDTASANAGAGQNVAAPSSSASTKGATHTSAQAANNAAAAEFFRSVNTGANAGLPLLGPGRISAAAGSKTAAAAGNRRLSFESDHSYRGEVGGAVVTPTASSSTSSSAASSNRSFGIGDNLYQGQMGGTVIAPGQKQRYRSSAKRVLPSVGEETEDMDIDLQSENVVRQADLLMAKMMEKQDKIEQAEVQPKRSRIDDAVSLMKKDGKEAAVPVGRDQLTVGLQHHGSRHAVSGIGTDGEEIIVSRSGGVLNKNYDGDAHVKDSEVNYATYRERNLVPLDPSAMVGEFSKPVEGVEPINTPAGVVWKRPEGPALVSNGSASKATTNAAQTVPFGTRPDDITPRAGHVPSIIGSFDAALRSSLDINPAKDSFTIKVAGNLSDGTTAAHIKSLIQTYGDRVQIVSISDGSVCVEDADGLEHRELLRLVEESSSVSKYNESKLSESGFLRRNVSDPTKPMVSTIKADVFFSSGASSTIQVAAITGDDGNVTAKLVVQDPNATMTDDAREALQKAGVAIIQNPQNFVNPSRPGQQSSILSSLDFGLREAAGIDSASEAFTVKIAGGPGDLGTADEIKMIISTYGDKAKIVAIIDESGCAEDPNGLDHTELLRLIDNKATISTFDTSKLSGGAAAVRASDTTEEKKAEETMLSRVEADAFLPLSGPGSIIDAQTYKSLLKEDGKASTKAIIEGTNARVTADARQMLEEEAGIVVQRQVTPLVATLDAQLRTTLDIDPTKKAFSVKFTGGPADESAAQEIQQLIREYGDKVKFVAIADESGCVEDANGIDHKELLRLVDEGKAMSQYDEKHLSKEGKLHLASTADGIKARNSMPHRIKSDVYIPAGNFSGSSIDVNNYRSFVQVDGSPSAAIIIETSGISSCVSDEARARLLDEAGVQVLSPSSLSPVELSRSAPLLVGSPISTRMVDADLGADTDAKTPGRSLLISSPGDQDVSMMPLADDQALTSPSAVDDPVEESPYKHLDFSVNSDSVSSLGSLGDLTQDDITVATTTLFNFLRQETENIRKMFEESERAEREALEGVGSGDNASVHTRQSVMSKESEEIRRATQQAELMAKSMAQATSWIDGADEDMSDGGQGDDMGEEEDLSPGRLYSIHQTGDMLDFGIDSTIKSVRWDAYWSSEHSREYYHEPMTNTTTWTRPPGVRVDSQSPFSRNPSAAPTEGTSILSDEVEVRDYTSTGEGGGSITPSSVYRNARSPGESILSDVTYEGDRVTPRSRDNNLEFCPDSGIASNSLAQYRLKQKRRRRRRRRRAVVAAALLFFVTAVVFLLKGTELVPFVNKMSGGRIARAVVPFIDESTAIKYGLLEPPKAPPKKVKKPPSTKKKTASTSESTTGATSKTIPRAAAQKKEEPKASDPVNISSKRSQNEEMDTKQAEKRNPNIAKSRAAALNAETEKMMRRRRAICNIPFAFIFYRPCWRESRSLPLDMSFLDSTMQ